MTRQRSTFYFAFAGLATFLIVAALDQLSKFAATTYLEPRHPMPVLGDWFRLFLIRNPGAAFSLGTDSTVILASIQLVAVAICFWIILRSTSRWTAIIAGLIGGGAAGNGIDRLFREPGVMRGHVVDFLSFWDFAIFNVADMAITIGVVLYLIKVFVVDTGAERKEEETA